jgi:predicted enzyme related to lactoylglutathione lyase
MRFPHSQVRCGRSISKTYTILGAFMNYPEFLTERTERNLIPAEGFANSSDFRACYHRPRSPIMTDTNRPRIRFECINPILRVENMQDSLRFYVDALGFQNASWGTEDFTSITRDGTGIYLCRGGQGQGRAWIWIGVNDVEKLHQEYQTLGLKIRLPPTNYPWALEMHLEDPDGNVLRLGSEPK